MTTYKPQVSTVLRIAVQLAHSAELLMVGVKHENGSESLPPDSSPMPAPRWGSLESKWPIHGLLVIVQVLGTNPSYCWLILELQGVILALKPLVTSHESGEYNTLPSSDCNDYMRKYIPGPWETVYHMLVPIPVSSLFLLSSFSPICCSSSSPLLWYLFHQSSPEGFFAMSIGISCPLNKNKYKTCHCSSCSILLLTSSLQHLQKVFYTQFPHHITTHSFVYLL